MAGCAGARGCFAWRGQLAETGASPRLVPARRAKVSLWQTKRSAKWAMLSAWSKRAAWWA